MAARTIEAGVNYVFLRIDLKKVDLVGKKLEDKGRYGA